MKRDNRSHQVDVGVERLFSNVFSHLCTTDRQIKGSFKLNLNEIVMCKTVNYYLVVEIKSFPPP